MIFSILELVTCFKAGGPRLGLTMSQGATRTKSLGTTELRSYRGGGDNDDGDQNDPHHWDTVPYSSTKGGRGSLCATLPRQS